MFKQAQRQYTQHKRWLSQTEAGKAKLKILDKMVTELWNTETLWREDLNYIAIKLLKELE